MRRIATPFILAALAVLATACASAPVTRGPRVAPGDVFEFDGDRFQLQQVAEDFVLLRFRDPDEAPISGYVDEVVRVSRYELGQGRWYALRGLPGVHLQWLGLDSFALVRGAEAHPRDEVGLNH